MTFNELAPAIGQEVNLTANGLLVAVRIKDIKPGYGQPRFLVTPVAGSGERWVELSSLRAGTGQALTLQGGKQ